MTPDVEKINDALSIDKFGKRVCRHFLTSGLTNEGIVNAFTWLTNNILSRRILPGEEELGIIFSRWDEIIGLKILTTYPENVVDDPESVALKCSSISQFVYEGEQVKKSAFILPLPQLRAKAAIYYDYIQDSSIRGNRLPLSIILIYQEKIPNSIIDKFNSLVLDKFELIKKCYMNEENFDKNFYELHGTIRERLKSFKSTVKELRVAELQYKALFKAARDAILIIEQKSEIIIDANEQAENFFLLPLEKIIGSHMTNLKFDIEYELFREKMANQVSVEGTPPFGAIILNSEESFIPVEINASRIQMGGRNYIQFIIRDVTERSKAEQRLRESEENYRLISENANDLIIVINNKFEGEYINEDAYQNIMGYSKKDVIGKSVLEFIHPEDLQKCTQAIMKGFKKGGGRVDARFRHNDGHYVWLDIKGRPYYPKEGLGKALLIARDISERKKAESTIKKNLKFEKTVGVISSRFIDANDFDKAINDTLRDIGILCDANRAFLFSYNKNDKTIDNTHMWIEEGIKAKIQDLQKIPKMILLYWEQLIIENGYVHITDVSNLKSRNYFLKEHFESLKITSFLILPVYVRDRLDIMMGFDNFSKPKDLKTDDITLLRVTSNIIGSAMERRLSEDIIKESEEKYRLITENANDMIGILNDRFEWEYINEETFLKVLGYSNEDLIGKSSLLFVHPEDIRRTARKLRIGFKTGIGSDELRFRGRNGDYVWLETKGSTFTNRNGELKALLISRDISERKKAEERIRNSERKYRHLYENSPNAIVISNKDGIILESNSITTEIFGYGKSEFIGKNYADLRIFTKEQIILLQTRFEDMMKGKKVPPQEFQIQKENGKSAWVYYQSSLIKLHDDFMVEALIQDISQQKIAEKLLRESEEKYRVISETAYDLIGILNSKFKYEYINEQAFKQILGYFSKDLIGKSALKFTHPDDMIETAQALRDGFKEGSGGKELRFKHADGHWVWIEAKGKTYHDINGDLKAIVISRDISERKKAEQKLQATERNLRERVKELSVLFGISQILEKGNISIEEILFGVLHLIPSAWQYPEVTCARIALDNKSYKTENFRETEWKLITQVDINEKPMKIEVFYLEDNPFLEEEKALIREIGNRLKITIEKIDTEQNLRASEIKYRKLVNSISDLLLEVDLKGKITYASPQIYDMFGFTPSEIQNTRIHKFIHPDDMQYVMETMKKGFETKKETTLEYRTRHKDGHYIHASVKGIVLSNGRFYGVVRDITSIKIAEHKFRSLLDTSPVGIIELNLITMKIDYINPKLREAIGLDLVELNRKHVYVDNFDLSNNTAIEFKIYNKGGLIWLTGKKILQHNKPDELKSAIIWITEISDNKKLESTYVAAASSIRLR